MANIMPTPRPMNELFIVATWPRISMKLPLGSFG